MTDVLGTPVCPHGAGIQNHTEDWVKLPDQPKRQTGTQILSVAPGQLQVQSVGEGGTGHTLGLDAAGP